MGRPKGSPKPPGSGRKKGSSTVQTQQIKEFVGALLDKPEYRESLERRLIAGECPAAEKFLLERFVGRPVEHVEITTNVPLFALPKDFRSKENEEDDGDKADRVG